MKPMEEVLALQSYAQAEAEVGAGACFSYVSHRETIAIAAQPAEPNGGQ
jgi:hypothetical protein